MYLCGRGFFCPDISKSSTDRPGVVSVTTL
jgi:hypothetical protein